MKRTHETMTCSKTQALIEAYLDKELTSDQVSQIDSHLRQCSTCAEELQLAKRTCKTLRSLPVQYCSDRVKAAVLDQVRWERNNTIWKRVRAWLTHGRGLTWRPAFATAVLVALMAMVMLMSRHQQPSPTQVSQEELARAEIEVKWTLAYLGEISQRTGIIVRDEVIGPRVVAPMKKAIENVLENESML